MRILFRLQVACLAMLALLCASPAGAFNTSIYATQSKLSTGKWVKISIPENGVYEITYTELREMGFTNPSKVHVYGKGGNRISEKLDGSATDDLNQVPILRTGNKICFYGNGPVAFTLSDYSTNPHFTRVFNPYSQVGCYFLTEDAEPDRTPIEKVTSPVSEYVNNPLSLGYFFHEYELTSLTSTGKEMLGEDFSRQQVFVDYHLPHLADSTIVVQTAIAAYTTGSMFAGSVLHSGGISDTTLYSQSSSRINQPTNYVYYNFASPYAKQKLIKPAERGQYEPIITPSADGITASIARLDYFILTYKQENILADAPDNQLLMGYGVTRGQDRFMLPNAPSSTIVWFINNPHNPMVIPTIPYNDEAGTGVSFFSTAVSRSMYVAFDPAKTLKKISGYKPVENQNLHAMQVPDFLIITTDAYLEQANRLADLHRAVDGIDVAVVTQDQVFNEFSSGTRDAMAYRLLCKMLYDRDNSKFKNLLLMGTGSFDNREIMGQHPDDLLTYQSDNSNIENNSFTSDDFFGLLDDNSGTNITADKLRIGVGRITCADADEARSDVDKIVEYYANPDYGVWRNNTLVSSDSPDQGEYMFQGQGYQNQIEEDLHTGMHVSTVHNSMYPRSTLEPSFAIARKTATEAKRAMSNYLKSGAYFATYVGHAGPSSFTKQNRMWITGDVARTTYPHYPIFSTACCDVAHYDNDTRGIAELMFHKRDGGAIALLTSSRMVFSSQNDRLNQYFINALFSYDRKGVMPTLGEAYRDSKLGFTSANVNKMSFFLLGDPAMKVNYPISRFNITSVNGTGMTGSQTAQITPLSRFEIKAQVVDEEGNIDTGFNGDATVSLYDKEKVFTTLSFFGSGDRDIYVDRPKLAEITGHVTNGMFTGTMIAPRVTLEHLNDTLMMLIRVYAHKTGSDYMVNGFTKQVMMMPFNESTAINDNEAPVITAMYMNDAATFADGSVVAPNSVLYISASDNEGISMQSNSVANTMKLQLDGGKQSYEDVVCYATADDGGKVVKIEFPVSNLTVGLHTLTYTVSDMLGNQASRTISFVVGQGSAADLVADKMPAILDSDNMISIDVKTELSVLPEMTVRITDALGRLVWMTNAGSFPVTWDMKDMNGNKVPAGLYRYFGTYNDGVNYGGTSIKNLVILEPVKTARN
ncbi:MAG: type IX secretion system sortase PorU [Bacteroidales bacterium]|nr:type IX secretion system sortase PorU [Bacteroidales bacterium]